MLQDYAELIRTSQTTVAESDGEIVALLALRQTGEGFLIENVAVDPAHQGKGLGKELLQLAEQEAEKSGFDSIYLYTHESMSENIALYTRIGYVEYERRTERGLTRVFMRKRL
jgi:ribosomal protein S18 acetylase RimI-like enzyme